MCKGSSEAAVSCEVWKPGVDKVFVGSPHLGHLLSPSGLSDCVNEELFEAAVSCQSCLTADATGTAGLDLGGSDARGTAGF